MRKFVIVLSLLLLSSAGARAADPFVLVELFGSEGCSSCPAADDLLRRITQEAKDHGSRIFTLSFQVDYWNNLGWRDPFSDAQYTQRQYKYAAVLGSSSVYTPQMIINGKQAFVGSDEAKASEGIDHFLQIPAKVALTLQTNMTKDGKLQIQYHCDKVLEAAVINFALVQHSAEISVKAGENAGRTLTHSNVVLDFKTIELKADQGEIVFTSTAHMQALQFVSVIAYVQNIADMRILGAQELDLATNLH